MSWKPRDMNDGGSHRATCDFCRRTRTEMERHRLYQRLELDQWDWCCERGAEDVTHICAVCRRDPVKRSQFDAKRKALAA